MAWGQGAASQRHIALPLWLGSRLFWQGLQLGWHSGVVAVVGFFMAVSMLARVRKRK